MTIKTQLRVFLLGIIAVPLLYLIAVPIYHYATRPERILMSGYKQIRKMNKLSISERDIEVLKQVMRTLPPHVEFILLCRQKILLTNFAEYKGLFELEEESLFKHMNETSEKYFYQLVSPPLEDEEVMLVSRVNRDEFNNKRRGGERTFALLFISIAIFEAFSIAVVITISRTISRSITYLENSTERIADGKFDVPLIQGKSSRENEITRLAENLEKMRLALKDDSERRAKLIMGISHDLRTPVAVIKGYTEAMSDGMFTTEEEMKKSLEIVASKTEQLETMVNTLIDFVKLNQTDWRGTLKAQPILPLFREFAKEAKTTGEVFNRNVETDVQIHENTLLRFDSQLIQRALENILSNAIRYSSDGDSIKISAKEIEENIEIKITDTGIGIEKKEIAQIFDMFFRSSASRREGGIGVGLSVVKMILDTHGWSVAVKSQKGVGTEFTITAPIVFA